MKTIHEVITEFIAQHSSAPGVHPNDPALELTKVLDSLALVELIYTIETHIGRPLELEQIIDGERLQRERIENWIEQSTPGAAKRGGEKGRHKPKAP